VQLARKHRVDAFITTEKDAVRLTQAQRAVLESAAPLRAARLTVSLHNQDQALRRLLALLPAGSDMRKS
jgi:tetraacyldisaccharide 4'-kinase